MPLVGLKRRREVEHMQRLLDDRDLPVHRLPVVMRDPLLMNRNFGRGTGHGPAQRPAVYIGLVHLAGLAGFDWRQWRICRCNASGSAEGQAFRS